MASADTQIVPARIKNSVLDRFAPIRQLTRNPLICCVRSTACLARENNAMWSFFAGLLNSSIYSPHGICLLWDPELIWLHVISDAVIA